MTFRPAGLSCVPHGNGWKDSLQFLKPLVLLATPKQFEYQATNRLILAASEEYGDSGKHKRIL